ncbi:MAG: hypothetical protein IRY95_01820 [Clostridia bacterium]|nr:hypothetical protein [Clostridia bacterium]
MAERLIREQDAEHLRKVFREAGGVAVLALFVEEGQPASQEMRRMADELAALHDGLRVVVWDVQGEEGQRRAATLGVDQTPTLALLRQDGSDTGVRFLGVPGGYEFAALVEDLVDVLRGETRLQAETRDALRNLTEDLLIRVFSTPT